MQVINILLILSVLFGVGIIPTSAYAGVMTANNYFYLPAQRASGTAEYNLYNNALIATDIKLKSMYNGYLAYLSTATVDPGHKHSKLWASDGDPVAVTVSSTGLVGIGMTPTSGSSLDVDFSMRVIIDGNRFTDYTSGGVQVTQLTPVNNASGSFNIQTDLGNWLVGILSGESTWTLYDVTNSRRVITATTAGRVGIGKTNPGSILAVSGLPTYADNAAAIAGGLTAGDCYRTATGVLMVTYTP